MSERRSISICENVLLVGLISLGPMNSFLAICEILWFQRQKCLENISSRGLVTLVSNEVEGSSIVRVSWKVVAGVEGDAKPGRLMGSFHGAILQVVTWEGVVIDIR